MKNPILLFVSLFVCSFMFAQNYYWVEFTDKNESEFNPYEYFDNKAIERRTNNNISLFDISDYPINENYVKQVSELSEEYIGQTRWFNSVAILASDEAINKIKTLSFVKSVNVIINNSILCDYNNDEGNGILFNQTYENGILPQLTAMQGEEFVKNDIDGKGIRIAVFDGGFPDVDTHDAFEHLRKNNQIIKTYNFPKKQEDVYGWNSHGTMVLSCIAGLDENGNKMGLATGSEFLLARTEVNAETAKEEVYWMMAVEWADKNGADVINSSLGYGADRHNTTDMDGQKCLVTRAANMAGSKGMLVCNAMGNEGSQASWKTLGAPADADSILSIGGVEQYSGHHIDFSSYGPTADGRMKPNVSAWGKADVAKPGNKYGSAYGTSFASPLAAGFVACAWQTKKELTAMQLKEEVEKSAHLYPYYDYAVGYGVPKAGYFTGNISKENNEVFKLVENKDEIIIKVIKRDLYDKVLVLYHIESKDEILEYYAQNEFWMKSGDEITIDKDALIGGKTLRVYSEGQLEEYVVENDNLEADDNIDYDDAITTDGQYNVYEKDVFNDDPSAFGVNSRFYIAPYFSYGLNIFPIDNADNFVFARSHTNNFGLRFIGNLSKWYRIGINFDFEKSKYFLDYNYNENIYNSFKYLFITNSYNIELYQRFRFVPGTMTGFGTYLDLGVYGNLMNTYREKLKIEYSNGIEAVDMVKRSVADKWNWGVRARLGYGIFAVYGQYRISDIDLYYDIPKLEVGVELTIPLVN